MFDDLDFENGKLIKNKSGNDFLQTSQYQKLILKKRIR